MRETERKYEAPSSSDTPLLPPLDRVEGVTPVVDRSLEELDAVYYDTEDLRLSGSFGTTDEMTALADAARPASPLRIESADDPDLLLPLLNRVLKSGDVVLVKASKSVGMEKFANILHAEVPA
ncbi:hypothetical protein [Streptomyces sp. NPDC055105]|uniref:hypothetical protein n=1 Tax=Streptomyces sp. NPDC055105 TaxID=3365719 RepID=UPI0037D10ED5